MQEQQVLPLVFCKPSEQAALLSGSPSWLEVLVLGMPLVYEAVICRLVAACFLPAESGAAEYPLLSLMKNATQEVLHLLTPCMPGILGILRQVTQQMHIAFAVICAEMVEGSFVVMHQRAGKHG